MFEQIIWAIEEELEAIIGEAKYGVGTLQVSRDASDCVE
jgi:hypothetical protein